MMNDSIRFEVEGRWSCWRSGGRVFAWRDRSSILLVGDAGRWAAGGGFDSPEAVERAYVHSWGASGPLVYGMTSRDESTRFDSATVGRCVRELVEAGRSDSCHLWRLGGSVFLGPLAGDDSPLPAAPADDQAPSAVELGAAVGSIADAVAGRLR